MSAEKKRLPSGTVTFLFTDVEGSTHLWADDSDAMSASLRVHDDIVRSAIEERGGYVFTTAGDAFCAAFRRATDGVASATSMQAALSAVSWPGPELRVRVGIHLGEAEERNGDYFGPVVNLAARVESTGHGGQTLITDVVRQAAQIEARDLGAYSLRGVPDQVRIFQIGPGEFPRLRVNDSSSTNLPTSRTTLIGRAAQVRSVRTALRASRLVTLVAGGGTGKTRLSIAVGDEELPGRRDGVWFADLTAVAEPHELEPAIANAMQLSLGAGDPTGQILQFVTGKDMLLVLDNCEHLVDECAGFAEAFLSQSGESQILATSREALDIEGERTLQIPPLPVVDTDSPSVQLFIERAVAVSSAFVVDGEGRDTIVELCRRLDGLPLAIELAAARSTVMSPHELLAGIDDRFRVLHGARRRQRQRTLESTLDWSYNLLDPTEQRALRSLGAFVGTFDLDAAASVIGAARHVAADLIESLVAKSLVDRVVIESVSRFRLFETTTAYAQQNLVAAGESEAARDRHLEHYHGLNAHLELDSLWKDFGALDVFRQDRPNIVAAFEWGASQDRWQIAGELLSGALRVLLDDDQGALRLIDRSIAALDDPDGGLVLKLHESRLLVAILATDWGRVNSSIVALSKSPQPLSRVLGRSVEALLWLTMDLGRAKLILDEVSADLAALGSGRDQSQGELFHHAMLGLASLFDHDIETSLKIAESVLDAWDGSTEDEMTAQHARTAAVCHLILGQPQAALAVVDRTTFIRSVFGTMDFYSALCHIALGELEAAKGLMRPLAQRSASGRVRLEAGSMLLVFAALAHAENDEVTARQLLLTTWDRRTIDFIAYSSHFAQVLGVRSEYGSVFRPLAPEQVAAHQRACIEAVQTEMSNRGWNTPRIDPRRITS